MKIAIGCDPNAQSAKEELIKFMIDSKDMDLLQILEVKIQFMSCCDEGCGGSSYWRIRSWNIDLWNRNWCLSCSKQSKGCISCVINRYLFC